MQRFLALLLVTSLVVAPVYATCGGGGGGGMGGAIPRGGSFGEPKAYVVPWKVLKAGEPALATPLTIYWFPASNSDMLTSDLNASRILTLASAQCVGMQLVKPGDVDAVAKWDVVGKLPTALLVADGKAIAHVDAKDGRITASAVENMLNNELFNRETALETLLDEAKKKADAADKDGAVAAYQKVWES